MSTHLKPETYEQQSRLAAYCRNGEQPALDGITPNRIGHYRRLVFNVVKDALTRSYPLAVNLLEEEEWAILCNDFFEFHPCQDPQVWKMPEELISFVQQERAHLCEKYPHLLELLRFEWKEVEYYMMPDRDWPIASKTNEWQDAWSLNPESEVLSLEYPVHLKNARQISEEDHGSYYCLVFRHEQTGKVHFMNLSPFFAWLIATMLETPVSPKSLLPVIEAQFGISDEPMLREQISKFHQKLVSDRMIR